MNVNVAMPERVWGRLATVAANRQTTVADVIARAILTVLDDDQFQVRPPAPRDNLAILDAELNAARAGGYRVPVTGNRARRRA